MMIGIDLGTRNALCAVREGGSGAARIIPNRWGTLSTPSVVAFAEDEFLAGEYALKAENKYPGQIWWDVKRKIGTDWRASYAKNGGTREAGAETLIVPLLKLLREDAEAWLKTFVYSCVVTVPAYFNSLQRLSVLRAAKAAGFSGEVKILNEPTAAAISVGNKEGRYLVLDFGAGTADISVVEMESNVWHVLESVGTSDIGGYDFDVLLAEWLMERSGLSRLNEDESAREIRNIFRSQAEEVKIALSAHERYVLLPFMATDGDFEPIAVEREDFNRLIRFHIRRVVNWVKMLWEQHSPQKLLLVGGSCKIPLLRQMLEQEVAPPEYFGYCLEEGVALGAAIHSSASGDSLLIDAVSQDITLEFGGKSVRIFQKGTPLPAESKVLLPVLGAGSRTLVVSQGARSEKGSKKGGQDVVRSDLGETARPGEEIMVRTSVDTSGLISLYVISERGVVSNLGAVAREDIPGENIRKMNELESRLLPILRKANSSQFARLVNLASSARALKDSGDLTAAFSKAEKEILEAYGSLK